MAFYKVHVHCNCVFIQTPKIVEATEKRQDPASPIQEVTREGSLGVKMDGIDGKVTQGSRLLTCSVVSTVQLKISLSKAFWR